MKPILLVYEVYCTVAFAFFIFGLTATAMILFGFPEDKDNE